MSQCLAGLVAQPLQTGKGIMSEIPDDRLRVNLIAAELGAFALAAVEPFAEALDLDRQGCDFFSQLIDRSRILLMRGRRCRRPIGAFHAQPLNYSSDLRGLDALFT